MIPLLVLVGCRPRTGSDRDPGHHVTDSTGETAAPTTPPVTSPPLDVPRVVCEPARPLASLAGPYAQLFGEMEPIGSDLLVSGGGSLVVEIGAEPGQVETSLALGCGVDVGNDYIARVTTGADIVWARVLHSCWSTHVEDFAAGPSGDVYVATGLSGPATIQDQRGVDLETLPYERDGVNRSMPLIGRFTPEGALDWTIYNSSDEVSGWTNVAADTDGSGVVVVGNLDFSGVSTVPLTWSDGHSERVDVPNIEYAWLIARFDAAGHLQWSHTLSGPPGQGMGAPYDIAFAQDRVVVSMQVSGQWLELDGVVNGQALDRYPECRFGAQLAFDRDGNVIQYRVDAPAAVARRHGPSTWRRSAVGSPRLGMRHPGPSSTRSGRPSPGCRTRIAMAPCNAPIFPSRQPGR